MRASISEKKYIACFIRALCCEAIRCLLGAVFFVSTTNAWALQPAEHKGGYPNVWYRLYEWPIHVCDKIFSDKGVWGDEPVLILCNGDKGDVIAEGFFSKKRYRIIRTGQKVPHEATTGAYRTWRYHYRNGRPMQVRELFPENVARPQKASSATVLLKNGNRIELSIHSEMNWASYVSSDELKKLGSKSAEILRERNEQIPAERRGIGSLVDFACEPLRHSLRLVTSNGQVVWDKMAGRYYSKGEIPPPHPYGDGICSGFKAWLSDGTQLELLLLADQTMLVSNYPNTFVVRMRLEDGSSGALPPSLRVLDNAAVTEAKREMVNRYLDEVMMEPPTSRTDSLAVMERLYGLEGIYRVLAEYFFEENIDKGYKK